MKALVRIKITRRPSSREVIGFRIEGAVPNEAQRRMLPQFDGEGEVSGFVIKDEMVPSFRSPYLITSSSDEPYINEATMKRFLSKLRWEGYSLFEFLGKYDGDALSDRFGHLFNFKG
jgi:hypothetical protein